MDVWGFQYRVRIPPIVILAACDTHPSDRSHASVGNGFLSQGAHTVLATTLPVHGVKSAVFIARLLFRLESLIPSITKKRSIRWSSLVWIAQNMMFIFEALIEMKSKGFAELSEAEIRSVQLKSTMHLHSARQPQWLGHFISDLAAATGKSFDQVTEYLSNRTLDCDALRYVQLGHPDRISVASEYFAGELDEEFGSPDGS